MGNSVMMRLSPLGGYRKSWPGLSAEDVAGDDLCVLRIRKNAHESVAAALASAYGLTLPEPGRAAAGTTAGLCAIWTGLDQYMMLRQRSNGSLTAELKSHCGSSATCVEQSDSWVTLQITGQNLVAVLERLCPLDLSDQAFPVHATTRTIMEHIPVVMLRREDKEGAPSFELMVLTSYAESFLHEVETAATSVCGPAHQANEI